MRKATLVRDYSTDTSLGTFGIYKSDSGFSCYILERPGTGDHPCIPTGTYEVKKLKHPLHGLCYEVLDVPGRTAILLHAANWYQELLGCLAPGRSVQVVEGSWQGQQIKQMGVTSSRDAVLALMADMDGQPFRLIVSQAPAPSTTPPATKAATTA